MYHKNLLMDQVLLLVLLCVVGGAGITLPVEATIFIVKENTGSPESKIF